MKSRVFNTTEFRALLLGMSRDEFELITPEVRAPNSQRVMRYDLVKFVQVVLKMGKYDKNPKTELTPKRVIPPPKGNAEYGKPGRFT